MSAFKPFIAGALAGAAMLYGSLQYHVVRSQDGFYIVPRAPQASLGLAYADLRGLSADELARRPELARAMAASSARQLLADNNPKEPGKKLTDAAEAARDRLNATIDDWEPNTVPQPRNSTIDAPIWNPFADDPAKDGATNAPKLPKSATGSDGGVMFGADELPDAEPWPSASSISTDAIPSAFDSEIEFDPYVNESDAASDNDTAFMDIARELDRARTLTENRARQLGSGSRSHTAPSRRPFGTDVDLTAASGTGAVGRTHTTNHVVPSHTRSALPSDENQNLQNAVTRRARQIYERTRRHSSNVAEGVVRRGTSKATSAIDELISPFDNLPSEFSREAGNRITAPKRYSRRAK